VVYGSHYIQNTEGTMAPSTPAVFSEGCALKSDQSFEFIHLSPPDPSMAFSIVMRSPTNPRFLLAMNLSMVAQHVLTCIG